MPCAEDKLCVVQASLPECRDGHGCQGTCGGRLHGTCGSVVGDSEMHRIYSKCLDKKGKRKKGALGGHIPALLRDSEPSIAPVLALFRVVPAPLSSAGVLGGHIPALLGAPHCIYLRTSISY